MDKIKYLEILKDCFKNNHTSYYTFTKAILEIATYEANNNNLKNYFSKLIFFKNNKSCFGYYDPYTKDISIEFENSSDLFLPPKEQFSILLETLLHELEHVRQEKILNEPANQYDLEKSLVYNYSYSFMELKSEKYYFKIHDLIPIEHEANFMQYYKFYKDYLFLAKLIKEEIDNKFINKTLVELLTSEYRKNCFNKIISPFERIYHYKLKNNYFKILNNNLSNFDKLKLGLPVEDDLIYTIQNELITDKDFNNYVKKL